MLWIIRRKRSWTLSKRQAKLTFLGAQATVNESIGTETSIRVNAKDVGNCADTCYFRCIFMCYFVTMICLCFLIALETLAN